MPPAEDGNPLAPSPPSFQFTFDTTQRLRRLAGRNRRVIKGFKQISHEIVRGFACLTEASVASSIGSSVT